MAINPSLLIAAPMLQDYLVDKDTGLPLANGTITLYSDTQRSILKPWYEQQGTNPPYSYVPLPNPMTLSSVGTIQDVSGNDVIPFFYPYEADNVTFDSYFIVVRNSNGELQFTRSNFPFVAIPSSAIPISTNENLLVNNVFWRNVNSITLDSTNISNTISINSINYNYWTLAPSQHDGYIMPDISYYKNATDGTETISFPTFISTFNDNVLLGDVTPEFYMNINNTVVGSATVRYLQIPLSLHIDSLSGFTQTSFTIQAMSVDDLSETLTVGVFQFCGTGVTSPPISVKTFILGPGWNKFIINLPIPSAQSVTVGNGGDDALFIQIGFPNTTFNVNIAIPSFYLSNSVSTNSFQTYDEVNSIISSPRTGDTRSSINSFMPYGWVPANDGVIALNTPTGLGISRINKDTWPLYNLIWNIAKPYDSGSNFNPISQIYTNLGVATNFGSSAYADFSTNNCALTLTRMFGRVMVGTVPISSLLSYSIQPITASNSAGNLLFTVANGSVFFQGQPVAFKTIGSFPGNIVGTAIYYITNISGNTFNVSTTYANAIARTPVVLFSSTGSGTNIISNVEGAVFGEYGHLQSTQEIGPHVHVGSGGTGNFIMQASPGSQFGAGGSGTISGLTGNINRSGAQALQNVTQPGTFYNVFFKL